MPDLIAPVEAAYDLDPSLDVWITRILEAAKVPLGGVPVGGYVFFGPAATRTIAAVAQSGACRPPTRCTRLGAFWLCSLLLVREAGAINLTGFWVSPKMATCRGLPQAGAKRSVKASFAPLAHHVLVKCTDSFPEILSAMRIVSARTFPSDANGVSGRLIALFMRADLPGGSGDGPHQCQVVFERTSTADPGAAGCP